MISDAQFAANTANNLQRLLVDRGWSQSELARRSGVTQATISRCLSSQYAMSGPVLKRLADALDVSMDRLCATPEESSLPRS